MPVNILVSDDCCCCDSNVDIYNPRNGVSFECMTGICSFNYGDTFDPSIVLALVHNLNNCNGFFADKLNLKIASQYNYLNQSEGLAIEGVDDAQNFHRLMVIQIPSIILTIHWLQPFVQYHLVF